MPSWRWWGLWYAWTSFCLEGPHMHQWEKETWLKGRFLGQVVQSHDITITGCDAMYSNSTDLSKCCNTLYNVMVLTQPQCIPTLNRTLEATIPTVRVKCPRNSFSSSVCFYPPNPYVLSPSTQFKSGPDWFVQYTRSRTAAAVASK